MMIPHHEQAVQMSETLLKKDGIDAEVLALAKQVKAAQQPEIELMNDWLKAWGQSTAGGTDHGGMGHGMGGLMSEEEMAKLDEAKGTEAEELFLRGMIKHHQGAIEMANAEARNGSNPEATQLASDIVASQGREIAQMRELLKR